MDVRLTLLLLLLTAPGSTSRDAVPEEQPSVDPAGEQPAASESSPAAESPQESTPVSESAPATEAAPVAETAPGVQTESPATEQPASGADPSPPPPADSTPAAESPVPSDSPCSSCDFCCHEGKCVSEEECEALGIPVPLIRGLPDWAAILIFIGAFLVATIFVSVVLKYCCGHNRNSTEDDWLRERLIEDKIQNFPVADPFKRI